MPHPLSRDQCKPKSGQSLSAGGREYTLGGKLGDGAAGLVRKASDVESGSAVAIKLLAPDPKYIDEAAFDDVAARFRREGTRGAKLFHHSLLRIRAYEGNVEGSAFQTGSPTNPFIVMDRVNGGTLESYIRRLHPRLHRVFVVDETRLQIAEQIASALAHLHARGITHRDVKPANIFLSAKAVENPDVRAYLGDFGVVKWGDYQASLATGTLTVTMQRGLGTMKYMSPLQALKPREVTSKADMYSFGITLFELFTGQILPSYHHVVEITTARDTRGTTVGRWSELGYRVPDGAEDLAELILDMHRRGPSGRPTSKTAQGHIGWHLEAYTDE